MAAYNFSAAEKGGYVEYILANSEILTISPCKSQAQLRRHQAWVRSSDFIPRQR